MLYGSVCSGIEAASVAWEPLGWRASFFSEIEAFPRAVLTHRFPDVPLHGDFTTIEADDYEPIELLVGGTPCQDFSVAGLRAGMDGARGNLTLEFLALAGRLRPRWLVWENVPGVLSIDGGRAFGAILGGMGELGYGFAYRILDAQYFGIPQRRRRVFVVGYLGDWRPAAAVLLERASLRGDSPPSREAGQGIAASLTHGVDSGGKGGYAGRRREDDVNLAFSVRPTSHDAAWRGDGADNLIAGTVRSHPRPGSNSVGGAVVAKPCIAGGHANDPIDENLIAHTLSADGFDASDDGTGRGTPLVALDWQNSAGGPNSPDSFMTLCGDRAPAIASAAVRRLTPRECERLQGFPDDFTAVPYRGKPAADGPRYRAIGNSMAVPCMAWIGQRIEAVERLTNGLGGVAALPSANNVAMNADVLHASEDRHGAEKWTSLNRADEFSA